MYNVAGTSLHRATETKLQDDDVVVPFPCIFFLFVQNMRFVCVSECLCADCGHTRAVWTNRQITSLSTIYCFSPCILLRSHLFGSSSFLEQDKTVEYLASERSNMYIFLLRQTDK